AGATTGQQLLYALDEQVRRYEVEGLVTKYEGWEYLGAILDDEGVSKGIVAQDIKSMEIKSSLLMLLLWQQVDQESFLVNQLTQGLILDLQLVYFINKVLNMPVVCLYRFTQQLSQAMTNYA